MKLFRRKSLLSDRRGIAAAEFALLAPAMIFLVVGVLEMALRFRASEEASRYVHQAADLVAREDKWTKADLKELYDAAVHMMKPLEDTDDLDLDVAQIGFQNNAAKTPFAMWRRFGGAKVDTPIADANGMGLTGEGLVRVAVRYSYSSPLTAMIGGRNLTIIKRAYARPRESLLISIDTKTDDGGAPVSFE